MTIKQIKVLILLIILVITSLPANVFAADVPSGNVAIEDIMKSSILGSETTTQGIYKVTFNVTNKWQDGFQSEIILENTGEEPIENWKLQFDFEHEINNIWNAQIEKHEGNTYTLKNLGWNQDIPVGEKIIIGFTGSCLGEVKKPTNYQLLGTQQEVDKDAYTILFKVTSDWGSAFNGEISITNNTEKPIEDWQLAFDFDTQIDQFWTAQIIENKDGHYIIKNLGYNANIGPSETLILGFSGSPGNVNTVPTNYKLTYIGMEVKPENPILLEAVNNVVFAEKEGDSIIINSQKATITGNMSSNGCVSFGESEVKMDGICQLTEPIKYNKTKAQISKIVLHNDKSLLIPNIYEYFAYRNYDEGPFYIDATTIEEESIDIDGAVLGNKELSYITKDMTIKKDIMSYGDLNIQATNLKSQADEILFISSYYGDITINADEINLEAVIFAPEGTVNIIGKNVEITGKIIAKEVKIQAGTLSLINQEIAKDKTDVLYDIEPLEISYQYPDQDIHITKDITLPTYGKHGTTISWESSMPEYISSSGEVNRPQAGVSEKIQLKATITKGEATAEKIFDVKVIKENRVTTIYDNSWENIAALNGGEMPSISIGNDTGVPSQILGKYSDLIVESPEEAINSLNSIKSIMEIVNPSEELNWILTDTTSTDISYTFKQVYKGITVYGRTVSVGTDSEGNVFIDSTNGDLLGMANTIMNSRAEPISVTRRNGEQVTIKTYQIEDKNIDKKPDYNKLFEWLHSDGAIKPVYKDNTYFLYNSMSKIMVFEWALPRVNGDEVLPRIMPLMNNEAPLPGVALGTTDPQEFKEEKFKDALETYINLEDVYTYYMVHLGRNSVDGNGNIVFVTVNYRKFQEEPFVNAQWNLQRDGQNRQLLFGEGDIDYLPSGLALDIVGHEYTHGVIDYKGKLGTAKIAGAINEAYADILGNLIESSFKKDGNSRNNLIGESIGLKKRAVRSLAIPGQFECAATIYRNKYFDKTEKNLYANSGVISHAAYLMAFPNDGNTNNNVSIDGVRLARLWYKSIDNLSGDTTSFWECREAVVKAARQLDFSNDELKTIKYAFDNVGIKTKLSYVNSLTWYGSSVDSAVAEGVVHVNNVMKIQEDSDDNRITNEEFLFSLLKAYECNYIDQENTQESQEDPYNIGEVIAYAYDKGIINKSFQPDEYITRQEAIKYLWEVYKLQGDKLSNKCVLKSFAYNNDELATTFIDSNNISEDCLESVFQLYKNAKIGYKLGESMKLDPTGYLDYYTASALIMRTITQE